MINEIEHIEFVPTTYFKSVIPVGISGNCEVKTFVVQPLPAEIKPEKLPDWARRRPGTYTVLTIGGVRMMTDLYEEWWSQREAISKSLELGGHVLISGLGLGLIIDAILKPDHSKVEKATIIEQNSDVIKLVEPHFSTMYPDRLEVVHDDIFSYVSEKSDYSVVWHDIWPNPQTVPIREIERLRSLYDGRCKWQGFWTTNSFE